MNPPAWAESVLLMVLKPQDRDSVSGDLLEGYRESVRAGTNQIDADRWYVRQVAGFFWRATWFWGLLLATMSVGRSALDWFDPPASFYTRSAVTTYAHVAVFISIGVSSAWRGRSIPGAAAAGLAAQSVAIVLIFAAQMAFLVIWHDPRTLDAIAASGGMAEGFALPIVILLPALVLSALGGVIGVVVGVVTGRTRGPSEAPLP